MRTCKLHIEKSDHGGFEPETRDGSFDADVSSLCRAPKAQMFRNTALKWGITGALMVFRLFVPKSDGLPKSDYQYLNC